MNYIWTTYKLLKNNELHLNYFQTTYNELLTKYYINYICAIYKPVMNYELPLNYLQTTYT